MGVLEGAGGLPLYVGPVQDRPRGEPRVVDNMGVLEGAGGLPLYVGPVQDRPRGEPSVVDNMGVLEGAGGCLSMWDLYRTDPEVSHV